MPELIISIILLLIVIGAFFAFAHIIWRGPYRVAAVMQVDVLSTTCTGGHIDTDQVTRTIHLLETRRGHRKATGFHSGDSFNDYPIRLWLVGGELPANARLIGENAR